MVGNLEWPKGKKYSRRTPKENKKLGEAEKTYSWGCEDNRRRGVKDDNRDKNAWGQLDGCQERESERERERERERQRERERERERDTQRQREIERESRTETERDTHS